VDVVVRRIVFAVAIAAAVTIAVAVAVAVSVSGRLLCGVAVASNQHHAFVKRIACIAWIDVTTDADDSNVEHCAPPH
jgi:hypothetical protein